MSLISAGSISLDSTFNLTHLCLGPNLALKGMLSTLYGSATPVNFASWMGFAVPIMLVNLVLTWAWLQLYFMGPPWAKSRNHMTPSIKWLKWAFKGTGARDGL
jgi:hypothetical protein